MMTLRFDMRAPDFGAPASDLYASAIEMCAWAGGRGLQLLPLCGGLPPDLAWPYLERAATAVELAHNPAVAH